MIDDGDDWWCVSDNDELGRENFGVRLRENLETWRDSETCLPFTVCSVSCEFQMLRKDHVAMGRCHSS